MDSDDDTADRLWRRLWCSVWSGLSDEDRELLTREVTPFLASGVHTLQKDAQPRSALHTFAHCLAASVPVINIKPNLLWVCLTIDR